MRIGEMAIIARTKEKHAEQISERSEAEGWANEPTGSGHVSYAWSDASKAAKELADAIDALPPNAEVSHE